MRCMKAGNKLTRNVMKKPPTSHRTHHRPHANISFFLRAFFLQLAHMSKGESIWYWESRQKPTDRIALLYSFSAASADAQPTGIPDAFSTPCTHVKRWIYMILRISPKANCRIALVYSFSAASADAQSTGIPDTWIVHKWSYHFRCPCKSPECR